MCSRKRLFIILSVKSPGKNMKQKRERHQRAWKFNELIKASFLGNKSTKTVSAKNSCGTIFIKSDYKPNEQCVFSDVRASPEICIVLFKSFWSGFMHAVNLVWLTSGRLASNLSVTSLNLFFSRRSFVWQRSHTRISQFAETHSVPLNLKHEN